MPSQLVKITNMLFGTWRGLLFGLWVATLNPDIISRYDTGEVTVVADFMLRFLAQNFGCHISFFVTLHFIMLRIYMTQSDSFQAEFMSSQ
jgi:hypothetical protein